MAFCPRCGAATRPDIRFCTACGEELPAVPASSAASAAAGAPGAAAAAGPGLEAGRPVGKEVRPILVPLFSILTLGIYALYFWWRTSREMDAYAGSRAHPVVRIGVALSAAGILATAAVMASVYAQLDWAAILADPSAAPSPEAMQAMAQEEPLYGVSVALAVIGAGVLYAGLWRMWGALRDVEVRRGRGEPFDPRIALAIMVGTTALSLGTPYVPNGALASALGLLGLVAFVLTLVLYYVTQARLNEAWRFATGRV